jgi:hypothetical protein
MKILFKDVSCPAYQTKAGNYLTEEKEFIINI